MDLLRRAFAILGDTLAAEDEALGYLPEEGELKAQMREMFDLLDDNVARVQPIYGLVLIRQSDRRQSAFDVGARQLKPRRQLERRAETIGHLVDRKAGWLGRDLEQDAAGFAEIYRTEIPAIENRRNIKSERKDLFAPSLLLFIASRAERDVVDGAAAPPVALSLGLA